MVVFVNCKVKNGGFSLVLCIDLLLKISLLLAYSCLSQNTHTHTRAVHHYEAR